MADRSAAAKKAAETRRLKREAEEYAAHNVRRPSPETGEMEVVSTPDSPAVQRHPLDPLPPPVTFAVQRQSLSAFFANGKGELVLRYSGPGDVANGQLRITVVDEETFNALSDPAAPWWDVTLTPRRAGP